MTRNHKNGNEKDNNNNNEENDDENDDEIDFVNNNYHNIKEDDDTKTKILKLLNAYIIVIPKAIELQAKYDIQKKYELQYMKVVEDLVIKNKNSKNLIEELKNKLDKKQQIKKNRFLTQGEKNKVLALCNHKCANKPNSEFKNKYNYNCPLWQYGDGTFDVAGYEIDHIEQYSKGGKSTIENSQALCLNCHSVKSKFYTIGKRNKNNN